MKHSNNARRAYSHHAFFTDARGAIVLIFALLLVPLVIICGMASDVVRINALKRHVQFGVDMAALAAARDYDSIAIDADATDLLAAASASFIDNMEGRNGDISCQGLSFSADLSNSIVTVEGRCTVPAFLNGGFTGQSSYEISASATAQGPVSRIDLALVVDVSGSMTAGGSTKLDDLKTAANTLVTTLITAETGTRMRISLVPYATGVNAGVYGNPATGRADTNDDEGDGLDRMCVFERVASELYTDAPPAAGAYMVPIGGTFQCPIADNPVLPLSSSVTDLETAINGLDPHIGGAGTAGQVGVAWGWYTISPNWRTFWPAGTKPLPSGATSSRRVMVIMSDGDFNMQLSSPPLVDSSAEQAVKLCDAAKDEGVEIFTVGLDFASLGSTAAADAAEDMMEDCSTDPATHAFLASNGAELLEAYQEIAARFSGTSLVN